MTAKRGGSVALARRRGEELFELTADALERVSVCRWIFLQRDHRPGFRVVAVQLDPLGSIWVRVGQNGVCRALRLTDTAVDALIRMNDEHVLAFIEAVHRTDFHAVRVLTFDAIFGDDVSHAASSP